MGRALRAVSSERGRDPRRFTLMAFGGGGPIHAAGLAEMLGITRVIVPPSPGVFSAFGLLSADVEHHFVRTHFKTFDGLDYGLANTILSELQNQGESLLAAEGFGEANRKLATQVDMKYVGQTSELTVGMDGSKFGPTAVEELRAGFELEHEKTYGYSADDPLQLVNIRVVARGLSTESRIPDRMQPATTNEVASGSREVFFAGPGWTTTPVVGRGKLDASGADGPLVVEEYDSTTIVPPGWRASIDDLQNIEMEHRI